MSTQETKQFSVREWLAAKIAARETEMNDQRALAALERTNILDNDDKASKKQEAMQSAGLSHKEESRDMWGMFTDNGLITFVEVIYKGSEQTAITSVKVWSDKADYVARSKRDLLSVNSKQWANITAINGLYTLIGGKVRKYNRYEWHEHKDSAESYWINAIYARRERWIDVQYAD